MNQFLAVKALIAEHAPKKEVARRLGLDVRTVRKWARRIEAGGGPVPRRAVVPQVLDAFRERIPVAKTLEEFDFDFQPKLDVKLVKSLASCAFVEKHENVALVGQPGTGKSHLALALGMKAVQRGFSVRFTTMQDLAAELKASRADDSTEDVVRGLVEPDLVILDELGFTRLEPAVADAFFRVVASRYERGSVIVTSNKSFESWAEVFPDAVIASAVLDRLVHHAHLVPIVGESYRMKELKSRRKSQDKEPKAA